MPSWIDAIVWIALFGAVALPLRAVLSRSWSVMSAAAFSTLVISLVGIFTYGFLVFLAVCLELGAAVALRWRANAKGWVACFLVAGVVWAAIVPGQIGRPVALPWIVAFPLATIIGCLALLRPLPGPLRR